MICVDDTHFTDALTRGKTYDVLDMDTSRNLVKVRGNNQRTRWFPIYCFERDSDKFMELEAFTIDDNIDNVNSDKIEVTVTVQQGGKQFKRWCYFITPNYISLMAGVKPAEPTMLGKQGIIVTTLTPATIESALNFLASRNMLEDYTLPLPSHL